MLTRMTHEAPFRNDVWSTVTVHKR
jgi:hypothetical protein